MSARFVPPAVTLRQLQYLVAVAELQSFRRAAEACHVAQPSLSAQVAVAEEALGVQVFERSRSRVVVTPAGSEVVAGARRVLLAASDLAEASVRARDPLAGTLRVGVIPTVGPYLLPEVSSALRASLPRLRLVWVEDRTRHLLAQLSAGELDAALLADDDARAGIETETLFDDPFVLAAPVGHALARGKGPLRLDALADADEVLLLDDGHCLRDQVLTLCQRADARGSAVRATSLSTLAQMVAGGAGVTLLPSIAVPIENRGGGLVVREFRMPPPSRRLVLAWRRGSPVGAAVRLLAGRIREVHAGAAKAPERRPAARLAR